MSDPKREHLTWAKEQLTEIGFGPKDGADRQAVHTSVLRLLDAFLDQKHTDQTRSATLRMFTDLAQHKSLVVEKEDEIWTDAKLGQVSIGDIVRTKANAFSGAMGMRHNNRSGVIVVIRRGDIHVSYRDGKYPGSNSDSINVDVSKLEKRIR